jgi:hypothetical protein
LKSAAAGSFGSQKPIDGGLRHDMERTPTIGRPDSVTAIHDFPCEDLVFYEKTVNCGTGVVGYKPKIFKEKHQ